MEVFLFFKETGFYPVCFLHVCGGVSYNFYDKMLKTGFSPRMWRCFWTNHSFTLVEGVFSTYVEVFLKKSIFCSKEAGFLHVCGGVSDVSTIKVAIKEFSPRMWRCF